MTPFSARSCLVALGLALAQASCTATRAPASPPAAGAKPKSAVRSEGLSDAERALDVSDYTAAERLILAAPASHQRLAESLLARLYVETGRYHEAAALPVAARAAPGLALWQARALVELGRLDEAAAAAERAGASRTDFGGMEPGSILDALEARLVAGQIQLERGAHAAAEEVLLEFFRFEKSGLFLRMSEAQRARAFSLVGQAAHWLDAPADANDAFDESEQTSPASTATLLARGALFLDKYDVAHAEQVVLDALAHAPHHAEALVLLSRIRLAARLDFAEARRLVGEARAQNPNSAGARAVLAGLALHDLNFEAVERELGPGLAQNPRQLELLSLRAASRFLAEDVEGFERVVAEVEGLSPGYARLFGVVAEYAEWEHRYDDIERLLRRAVRLDRRDGRLRGELGLLLVRAGSDASGVVELREAFALDPYNARVLNTLSLYERLPRDYVQVEHGDFDVRYPKTERALLDRYVPELLERAQRALEVRYEYAIRAPIGIELYATPAEFAVRTTGLPHAGLAGVCFGRKLATVTPSGQTANLGMTLWHELSHVFHIGKSLSRVPRWLTEGLAERETALTGRGWSRELDAALYRALRDDTLPPLEFMTQAFTHAENFAAISAAYHASRRWADFIEQTRGRETVVRLLNEFGRKRLPNDVLPEVLGKDFAALDLEFRQWLARELARYQTQFISRQPGGELGELARGAAAPKAPYAARLDFALALVQRGQLAEAEPRLASLLSERFDADAAFASARIELSRGRAENARSLLTRAVAVRDGFELELALARLAAARSSWSEVFGFAERASKLDPSEAEAWSLLAAAAHESHDVAREIEALTQWAELSEHDGVVHRRLVTLLLETRRNAAAANAAERAIWAGLGVFETHRLAAEAFHRAGQPRRAQFELDTARLLAVEAPLRAQLRELERHLGHPSNSSN
jgi:Flp pilus assembly protein TadD